MGSGEMQRDVRLITGVVRDLYGYGLSSREIPELMATISVLMVVVPDMSRQTLNRCLAAMGWDAVPLDAALYACLRFLIFDPASGRVMMHTNDSTVDH
ncbi:MAG: hypothetical protein JW781_11490 [Deltaproteobacteria bacterium]|nr:hypothetical protein [Candidatus Anaeroferrophillacea bacterium]